MNSEMRELVKRFFHWLGHMVGMDCAVTFDRASECWRCKLCQRRVSILFRWW
jgi:hypothetical protein